MSKYQEDENRIAEALEWLANQNESSSVASAASRFGCQYSRLLRRTKGSNSRSTRKPANLKLSDEQESILIEYVKQCDMAGASARLKQLIALANSLLAKDHAGPDPAPTVSKMWTGRWLKRHPEFYVDGKDNTVRMTSSGTA